MTVERAVAWRGLRWIVSLAPLCGIALAATDAPARAPASAPQRSSAPSVRSLPAIAPTTACADLAGVDLVAIGGSGSRVRSAVEGKGAQPGTVCIVEGTLAPSIVFRVELPTATWRQRYLQTGCGGLCGTLRVNIGAADTCPAVDETGFVVATTDMGHAGMESAWTRDPQRAADFAYRGVHLTALAAKLLIRTYYGQREKFAYFSGCSDGGREALVEAQRFPQDFDGIIAGAPALNFQVQNSLFHGWQARANTGADGQPILVADRLPILHDAVIKSCDALDGQVDGLIATPDRCRFDPVAIMCKPGEASRACLTPAEATTARKLYAGPRDPVTGARLTAGGPQPGSELAWAGVYVPMARGQSIFSARIVADSSHLIFPGDNPPTMGTLTFDTATFERLRDRHALFDATNPDLSRFVGRGGKLILFHGWADQHISPINSIAYHDAVRRFMGAAAADRFERLYLLPGMYHCSGGEGPSRIDLLSALIAWVEGGRAPDAIVATAGRVGDRSRGGAPGGSGRAGAPPAMLPAAPAVERSRPVYPYPYIAAYSGKGDASSAANYVRGRAMPVAVPAWAGATFFRPYVGATQ